MPLADSLPVQPGAHNIIPGNRADLVSVWDRHRPLCDELVRGLGSW